jgi:hypothetical protein
MYRFIPSHAGAEKLGIPSVEYRGSTVAEVLMKALGINKFKKFLFNQSFEFKGHKAPVLAISNPDEKNDLKKMFEVAPVGTIFKDD